MADSATRFTKDTAAKTGASERKIRGDVKIATDIPEEIRDAIRDTPAADNKEGLLMLARQSKKTQKKVSEKLSTGKAKSVKDAVKQIIKEEPNENEVTSLSFAQDTAAKTQRSEAKELTADSAVSSFTQDTATFAHFTPGKPQAHR